MILNCVVIDDDPEALNQITSHIKRTPTLQLIGAYTSAREAVRDVRNGHVDVLYLAIQMPELSGIEFARLVPESCRLVSPQPTRSMPSTVSRLELPTICSNPSASKTFRSRTSE